MKTIKISREEYDRLEAVEMLTRSSPAFDTLVQQLGASLGATGLPDREIAEMAVIAAWRAARHTMAHLSESDFSAVMLASASNLARFRIVREAVNDPQYMPMPPPTNIIH